jgi:hypothetical protein
VYGEGFEWIYSCCCRPYLGSVIYRYLDCGVLKNGLAQVGCGECGYEYLLKALIDLKGNSHFVVGFNNGVSDKGQGIPTPVNGYISVPTCVRKEQISLSKPFALIIIFRFMVSLPPP